MSPLVRQPLCHEHREALLPREGTLAPVLCSIEEYLGKNTLAYYDVLAEVGGGEWHLERDATPWARFVLTAHLLQARTMLRRVKESERLRGALEEIDRDRGLPERAVSGLFDAAMGSRVRNSTNRAIACS